MFKKSVIFLSFLISLFFLTGCATMHKQKDLQIQGLKNQISALETQIQSKDDEIAGLRESLSKIAEEKERLAGEISKKKVIAEVKSRPNVKQIQIALRNAGYNPGSIDGKMGRQTREAIKAFQRANNLTADGKVGKLTWVLLKEYLYKKAK